jgi:hypothetical protein
MNKLRTVHGTVLEHQIKNIIGTTQGQIFRTNHYQEQWCPLTNPDIFLQCKIVLLGA